jgi:hypothetical protein
MIMSELRIMKFPARIIRADLRFQLLPFQVESPTIIGNDPSLGYSINQPVLKIEIAIGSTPIQRYLIANLKVFNSPHD